MKKLAVLFSGQGSQFIGMGKSLSDAFPVAQQTFQEANDILGFDIQNLCFNGSEEELLKTYNSQCAIVTTSIAVYRVYAEIFGILPSMAAGHSLGEYSALIASGVLTFSDGLGLVKKRAELMQEATRDAEGAMLAVLGLGPGTIETICADCSSDGSVVVVANYNSQNQIVVSGHKSAVEKVQLKCDELEVKSVMLNVSGAFHSPLMKSAADNINAEIAKYQFHPFSFPVISNVTGKAYRNVDEIKQTLSMQLVSPVRWIETIDTIADNSIALAIEMGPKNILTNLISNNNLLNCYAFSKESDLERILDEIPSKEKRAMENKKHGINLVNRCLAIAVSTKNNNTDADEYRQGVLTPYQKIKTINDEIAQSQTEPSVEKMENALKLLKEIFHAKKTPAYEQVARFNQLFDETLTREHFKDFPILQ